MDLSWKSVMDVFLALGGLGGLAALLAVIWERRNKNAVAVKTESEAVKVGAETRKVDAEATAVLIDSSGDLLGGYRHLVTDLTCQVSELRRIQNEHTAQLETLNRTVVRYAARIEHLMGGIDQLIKQIKRMDGTPEWRPEPWMADDSVHPKEERR